MTGFGYPLRFRRGPRERLFAQHVLAGLGGSDRPLRVQAIRQRVVDRVDVRIGQQRLVRAVRALDAALSGIRLRRLAVRLPTATTVHSALAYTPGTNNVRPIRAVLKMPQRKR